MSMIYGVIRFDGARVGVRDVERMGRTMAHRAPDGQRAVSEGVCGLGQGLMRITEEDFFEAQPLRDPARGLTLVADARIDNRQALAEPLGIDAAALRDMPDSALMLAAYRQWGEDFPKHLIGDFAYAVWDAPRGTLLIGRDHMGQRPLLYHHGDGLFVFATEAKALWAIEGVPRAINEDQLGRRLMKAVDRDVGETDYRGIHIVRGGTAMAIGSDGKVENRNYWEPHAAPEHVGRDDAYYLSTYKAIVEEAIACRVRRLTRPPGLCFSGGFDSATIAVVAGPIVAARGQKVMAATNVRDEGDGGDRNARAIAAGYLDRPYLDLVLQSREGETLVDDLEESWIYTENASSMNYAQRALFRSAAQRGARLMMDGHGGDYTVNRREPAMLGRLLRAGHLAAFFQEFRALRRRSGGDIASVIARDVMPALTPLRWLRWRRERQTWRGQPANDRDGRLASASFAAKLVANGIVNPQGLREFGMRPDRWEALQARTLRRMQAIGPAYESIAAWQGLLLTRPFHDKRIVEFALALPLRLLFRDGTSRYLARQAFGDVLAAGTLARMRGNDSPNPDLFEMAIEAAPSVIADAQALVDNREVARLFDLKRAIRIIKAGPGEGLGQRMRYIAAIEAVIAARFAAWFDQSNRQ